MSELVPRFVADHDVVVVREGVQHDVVQVQVETSKLVNQQQPQGIGPVDCRVLTVGKLGT